MSGFAFCLFGASVAVDGLPATFELAGGFYHREPMGDGWADWELRRHLSEGRDWRIVGWAATAVVLVVLTRDSMRGWSSTARWKILLSAGLLLLAAMVVVVAARAVVWVEPLVTEQKIPDLRARSLLGGIVYLAAMAAVLALSPRAAVESEPRAVTDCAGHIP